MKQVTAQPVSLSAAKNLVCARWRRFALLKVTIQVPRLQRVGQLLKQDHTLNKEATQRDSFVVRHSFIVRIWREGDGPKWRGWVQHTRTQESAAIEDLEALLAFIERRAGRLTGGDQKGLSVQ